MPCLHKLHFLSYIRGCLLVGVLIHLHQPGLGFQPLVPQLLLDLDARVQAVLGDVGVALEGPVLQLELVGVEHLGPPLVDDVQFPRAGPLPGLEELVVFEGPVEGKLLLEEHVRQGVWIRIS